ncbi:MULTISPECIES: MnhB domain-containing protein [Dethiosulfovibrio]|uniref:Sodium:proton antiporter n=2 Tax=Dethiosulfovibrio TaxID=47054 RepID=A0ABS9EMB1_9BACT|nr:MULTISPECIES: MnhB domain-containing protein [Dethiosulfovibrio]MCF4113738.1 sodium:proton antiporter [Dethiosulfovibrio russensis]MCF4141849.1 sodium:proton antiporter [Dethiosulfovibrio marinus]MCF4143733.1 sodium:proton antiporter [Dethiosulfovibrio acidaminovorans]MEA3284776.1 MnhB domain-containing protein [Synergistota bacterium]
MRKPLSLVARTVCDLFAWFLIIFGVYVIIHGDVTPGGGFQGGAIVGSFMALLLVAHGGDRVLEWVKTSVYWIMLFVGLMMFIGFGLRGIPEGTFFYNFLAVPHDVAKTMAHGLIPFSGTIGVMDIAVGIEVAGGLTVIILSMFRGIVLHDFADSRKETGHDG